MGTIWERSAAFSFRSRGLFLGREMDQERLILVLSSNKHGKLNMRHARRALMLTDGILIHL
jgi:hypothetical protein